ncbi:Programmed cell death protein 6 [Geranomyces michiganensis]|nr:Programmed cell death protein 6 [Geranomyces michiganensis]
MYPYPHGQQQQQPPLPARPDAGGRRTSDHTGVSRPGGAGAYPEPYVAFPAASGPPSGPYQPPYPASSSVASPYGSPAGGQYGLPAGSSAGYGAQPTNYSLPQTGSASSSHSSLLYSNYPQSHNQQQPSRTSGPSTPSASAYSSQHLPAIPPKGDHDLRSTEELSRLEAKLHQERAERRRLEERELERVTAMSALEDQLRSLRVEHENSLVDKSVEVESKLEHEREEKRRLMNQLGKKAQLESQLDYELKKSRDLQNNLEAEIAKRTRIEAEKKRMEDTLHFESRNKKELEAKVSALQEQIDTLSSTDAARRAEEEKQALTRQIQELEGVVREYENRKAEAAKAIQLRTLENEGLKRQLDETRAAINQEKLQADRLRGELEAKVQEVKGLIDRLNHDHYAQNENLNRLHDLQTRYEPLPPPIGDESVYLRPPPTQPLPIPRGVDHELWKLFVMVDPYQLQAINAVQLRDIINHGPWPPLEYSTVRILHKIYDRAGNRFKFDDFASLWDMISEWVKVFRANDHHTDEAEFGHIERSDLRKVLKSCGVSSSETFLTALLTQGYQTERPLGWDDFMRCAARIKLMQNCFIEVDKDHDQYITLRYDQFLVMVVDSST